jgi:hypothetical protein
MQPWIAWGGGGALVFGGLLLYTHLTRRAQDRARRERLRRAWGQAVERGGPEPNRPLRDELDRGDERDESGARIDDQTWADLLLATVVEQLDRTITAVGSQTLFRWVRRPLLCATALERREAMIEAVGRDPELREHIQVRLLDFGVGRGQHLARLLWGRIDDPELPLWIMQMLPPLLLGSAMAGVAYSSLPLLGLTLAVFIGNVFVHHRASHLIAPMLPAMGDVGRLVTTASRLRSAPSLAKSPALRPALEQIEAALPGTRPLVRRTAVQQIHDPLSISEYLKIVLLLEVIRFYRAATMLRENQPRLRRLFDAVGAIDVAQAAASLRLGVHTCIPHIDAASDPGSTPHIEAEDLRHPLLDHAVGNDLVMHSTSLLVSGSNMSGKTTFLRTVAVNAVLAQSLRVAFAARYRGTAVRVASCITIADDLLGGRSYFRAELDAILGIVRRADRGGTLVVLDEIFRGTNPLERTAAATAVLDHLARNNLVLAATHDLEIGDQVGGAFGEAHFCEVPSDDTNELDFDYRLRPGRVERPNAIALLGRSGYPEELVRRAMALVEAHARPLSSG